MESGDHLLVDGFNVAHAWPQVHDRLTQHGPESAAEHLAEMIRPLHDAGGLTVTLVLDGKGAQPELIQPDPELPRFCLLYAPQGGSADAIIEQMVARANEPTRLVVASRDNMVRETVTALGARAVCPDQLADAVSACEDRQEREIRRRSERLIRDWGTRIPLS